MRIYFNKTNRLSSPTYPPNFRCKVLEKTMEKLPRSVRYKQYQSGIIEPVVISESICIL